MPLDPQAFKDGQRATWTTGNYPELAELIENVAVKTVATVGAGAGERVLDVATGTGNAALEAAQRGADVVGLDLTPKMLEVARKRAAEAGLEIEWIEGDAEDLPFADGSFDRAVSVFGTMFAPRHDVAAGELSRVVKDGGKLATVAWTPDGLNGRLFQVIGKYMPPPPEGFVPPVAWGTEDHVAGLIGDRAQLEFERDTVTFRGETSEKFLEFWEQRLGPVIMARKVLEPDGKYEALRNDMMALYEEFNEADDGSMSVRAEYLTAVGTVGS